MLAIYRRPQPAGKLRVPSQSSVYELLPNVERSFAAASSICVYIVCYTLIVLGYYLGLSKSVFIPQLAVPYPGFIVDSGKQAFPL